MQSPAVMVYFFSTLLTPEVDIIVGVVYLVFSKYFMSEYPLQTSIFYTSWILKNQKQKHKKIKIDPYHVDGSHSCPDKAVPGDNRLDNA